MDRVRMYSRILCCQFESNSNSSTAMANGPTYDWPDVIQAHTYLGGTVPANTIGVQFQVSTVGCPLPLPHFLANGTAFRHCHGGRRPCRDGSAESVRQHRCARRQRAWLPVLVLAGFHRPSGGAEPGRGSGQYGDRRHPLNRQPTPTSLARASRRRLPAPIPPTAQAPDL